MSEQQFDELDYEGDRPARRQDQLRRLAVARRFARSLSVNRRSGG